jgi:mRNA interferase RelE/StbE
VAYRVLILPTAEADLEALDTSVRHRALHRIRWLGDNADSIVHHRLSNMPDELSGLCRARFGDYRILYWPRSGAQVVTIYRIQHRREVYRSL